jgi:hypothetical protein
MTIVFSFVLEYAIKKIQQNKEGLELNGTHQLLTYADVNVSSENIGIIKKNTETLLDANKLVRFKCREHKIYVHVSSPDYRTKSLCKGS